MPDREPPRHEFHEDPAHQPFYLEVGRALSVFGGLEALIWEIYVEADVRRTGLRRRPSRARGRLP